MFCALLQVWVFTIASKTFMAYDEFASLYKLALLDTLTMAQRLAVVHKPLHGKKIRLPFLGKPSRNRLVY